MRLGEVMTRSLGPSSTPPEQRWNALTDDDLADVAEMIDERLALMEATPAGLLLLVDGPNALWRLFHVATSFDRESAVGALVGSAVRGVVGQVQAMARARRAAYVAVAFDAGDGGRGALWPAYKANRPPHPPGTEGMMDAARMALRAAGVAVVEVEGYEADDVIAAYTKQARALAMDVLVVSNDKDLRQLVGPGVRVYDSGKKQDVGPMEVEARFGVVPALLGDWLALVGDTSDNIAGVPGIGPKRATELLRKFGDLAGVLEGAAEIKGKRGSALVEHAGAARLARELVRLRDEIELPMRIEEMKT